MNTYFALVHKDANSSFGISFPDLPGCFSATDSEDRVFPEAQAALSLYASDEQSLPAASSLSELRANPEVKAEIASGAFVIAVPLILVSKKARYNLMLAADLVESIDATAENLRISRSEFVADAIHQRLERQIGAVLMRRGGARDTIHPLAKGQSTGSKVSSAASRLLKSKTMTKAQKSVAASALTQKGSNEKTSARVATAASKILRSKSASKAAKSAAASALTQKTKK